MEYTAPVRDMRFVLEDIVDIGSLTALGFEDLSSDLIAAVLTEAGKLASEVIAPLNRPGDEIGARLENGVVKTPPGFAEAFAAFAQGGWASIDVDPDYGGQGLPHTLALASTEMVQSANMAFSVCTLLTAGAIDAISAHGTPEQKKLYLEKLVTGEWTGTMNLTEPQAGSDVGALRTRAVPQDDGTYRITGTKIFISYGEHDMAQNIVHLVLARLPDAPPGTKGTTLFIVPKYLVNADGSLGARNDVKVAGIEHKLGIHGSPTCVMSYGEEGGAVGYLLGAENGGIACMFTMMNAARLGVGLQGVAITERAYQQALAYARERRQGKPWGQRHEAVEPLAIIEHADVRRMLMTMKAYGEAMRAICYATGMAIDMARRHPDDGERARAKAREELLTPIAKGFSSEVGFEMTSLGLQIHGGMGYVEETGAAQHVRDARITTIYEGTTGIQALDLVTRKLSLQGGEAVRAFLEEVRHTAAELAAQEGERLKPIGPSLEAAVEELARTTAWLQERIKSAPQDCFAGATPYLRQFGLVAGGYYLGLGALAAARRLAEGTDERDFYQAKIGLAGFYAQSLLPEVHGLGAAITIGADNVFALTPDQLAL